MRKIGKLVKEIGRVRLELRRKAEHRAAEALRLPYYARPDPRCPHWEIYILWYGTMAEAEQDQRKIRHWIKEEAKQKLARRRKHRIIRKSPWRETG